MQTQILFSCEDRQKTLTFSKAANKITLREAREKLVQEKFFLDDDGTDQSKHYRYVYPVVEFSGGDEEYLDYADRVLGMGSEKDISVDKMFLESGYEVVLTNVDTSDLERPDLIGFRTSFWKNGNMQVTCRLRPSYNSANVPEPYLLTDVITSRSDDFYTKHYPNVLVCAQNSIIEFPVACNCTVGMAYSAWINGERIFDYATPLPPYTSHDIALGSVDCFNNGEYSNERSGPKAIKVEKLSALDVSSKDFVSYSITFTTEDVTQWSSYENNVVTATYTENTKVPRKNSNLLSISTAAGSDGSSEQFVLDRHSYFAGKLTPGQDVPKRMPGVHTFSVDKKGDVLGTINVTVLVFKDMETAQKYVARYNPLI